MQAQKAALGIICAAAVLIVLLAFAGGALQFSRIPFWDMWDGTLGFVQRFEDDPRGALFGQHNEHRIVLTRFLFLLEYKVFGGSSLFLIIVNYLCAIAICATFWRSLVVINRNRTSKSHVAFAGLLMTAWLFLWTQNNNLTWAFQSQFFLAQLVPLLACLALGRAMLEDSPFRPWFLIAVVAGFVSLGTMANGVATLPLLAVGAAVFRMGWVRFGILAVVAVFAVALYFNGYHSIGGHGSLRESLLTDPIGLLVFVFRYLGSPFFYIFGMNRVAHLIAILAGASMVFVAVGIGLQVLRGRRLHHVSSGLLLFIVFVGLTAFVTAGGRLMMGSGAAFASRYTTPALMAWAALFCIFSPWILTAFRKAGPERFASLSIVAAMALFLLKYQFTALNPLTHTLHVRSVAALAAELDIPDSPYISQIYPNTAVVLDIANKATANDLAVFGLKPYKGLRERIGGQESLGEVRACAGNLERIESIGGSDKYVRVHGWQFDQERRRVEQSLRIVDETGRLVGFALTGESRPDVKAAVDRKAGAAGFTGYVLAEALGRPVSAVGEFCKTDGQFEPTILLNRGQTTDAARVSLTQGDVLASEGWHGSDFYKSELPGLKVMGTLVTSDADTGVIRLRMGKGQSFLYRSGPTPRRQLLKVMGKDIEVSLPVAIEWTLIELHADIFETDSLEVEISDVGSEWGEWSAIALRSEQPGQ
ncbi:hypothetical protein [Hyphomonas atlantica corrig.]|uniref:hypothetical protein n=1 Tax=Hyphomonas atlantica TaxID=1280948 RepID=UPI0023538EA2|nr:hypothetical protein [Hyphomonas atlantica]